ncbi:hypothetical protein TSUD_253620 [Trifolium subterraneum]|nr:hypothetical protein TSUD_253620 [Trifolium subterraneum]
MDESGGATGFANSIGQGDHNKHEGREEMKNDGRRRRNERKNEEWRLRTLFLVTKEMFRRIK